MIKPTLLVLGVMTGNSLDAVDTVITKLSPDGGIHDLHHYSLPFPIEVADKIRTFRDALRACNGDLSATERSLPSPNWLTELHNQYIKLIEEACLATIVTARASKAIGKEITPDLIGFHGQTCAHLPPSLARQQGVTPYTVQMGDGQVLANLMGIPVAYDFRSDDLLNGGEGAPLAPIHHLHLAQHARAQGAFPIAFINAGNTGNISVITSQLGKKEPAVLGWDSGPFNHFPDLLARTEAGLPHDTNGEIGLPGSVNETLLRVLFESSAITSDGSNFLTQHPPRSSDPQWYNAPAELLGRAPVDGEILPLKDRMRTAEYFAAYTAMHALSFVPADCEFPHYFGLCGGGWKNPVVTSHFRFLIRNSPGQVILAEHRSLYTNLIARLGKRKATVESSGAFGFDPHSMEARIFADAAARLVWSEPFTRPSVTGVASPTICGRIRFPSNHEPRDFIIGEFMSREGTLLERISTKDLSDARFNRAIRKL